ncbi:MAG: LamG domain-containing protein [Planctomycetota bacterium]|jgi:hypothetical protein
MARIVKITAVVGFLVLCGSALAADANDPNLIAHWKFDEGSGTTAYDSAGDNDGTLVNGPVWTTGQIGGALEFDGTNDYVVISNEENFDFGSDIDFTISLWIKAPSDIPTWMRIVDKCRAGHPPYEGIQLVRHQGDAVFAVLDSGPSVWSWGNSDVSDDNWHFVTVVADRDGDLQIYHNGVLEDSDPLAIVGNINNNVPLAIGRSMDYNGQYLNATIDELRIYNRALSAEEIWQLYFDGLDLYGSELSILAIEHALDEKYEALEKTDAALEKEYLAYSTLEALLASGDYGDLNKRDIIRARQEVHSAIQRQEQAARALEVSIEGLEDALLSLGLEPEP